MNVQTDSQLLRAYAEHRSEPAFAELVRRHVDFVYSAARRMVCSSHLAEDVSQSVFVALAKNAAQLTDRPVLSGWLHRTAQNIAAQTVRTDVRRRAREQEAAAMNQLLSAQPDASWEHIAPHLDAALGELSEPDRDAVLLRYFEKKSAQEMAERLGISDEAAQKRVSRAVERLREFFAKRGVTVGASGLVVVISANAVQAAPVGLAVTISTAAALAGTTLATTATAIKTIAMTTLQKAFVAVIIVVGVATSLVIQHQAKVGLHAKDQLLLQQNQQLTQLTAENERLSNLVAQAGNLQLSSNAPSIELLRLRGQVGLLQRAGQENARLTQEQEALAQKLLAAENDANATRSNREQLFLRMKKDLAGELGSSIQIFWAHHQLQMPATVAEALAYSDLKWQTRAAAESNGISADQFELLGSEIPAASAKLATLMLREKEPVRQYDGTWVRVYVDTAAGVETPTSTNGDFTVWEREHWSKRIPP